MHVINDGREDGREQHVLLTRGDRDQVAWVGAGGELA